MFFAGCAEDVVDILPIVVWIFSVSFQAVFRTPFQLPRAFWVQNIDGFGCCANHWAVSAMKLKEVFVDQSLDDAFAVE